LKLREGLGSYEWHFCNDRDRYCKCDLCPTLLNWSIFCSAAINEIVEAYDDHLSEELNSSKLHIGQQKVAAKMREHLKDSKLTRDRNEHLYSGKQIPKKIILKKRFRNITA
jgi:hypothetical protein